MTEHNSCYGVLHQCWLSVSNSFHNNATLLTIVLYWISASHNHLMSPSRLSSGGLMMPMFLCKLLCGAELWSWLRRSYNCVKWLTTWTVDAHAVFACYFGVLAILHGHSSWFCSTFSQSFPVLAFKAAAYVPVWDMQYSHDWLYVSHKTLLWGTADVGFLLLYRFGPYSCSYCILNNPHQWLNSSAACDANIVLPDLFVLNLARSRSLRLSTMVHILDQGNMETASLYSETAQTN